jgi:hypothetical protein
VGEAGGVDDGGHAIHPCGLAGRAVTMDGWSWR